MPWFRLDDTFHSHPKVVAAGNEAVGLYVRCGSYCAQHLTDGFIPEHVMLLYGSAELADTLVRTKLLRRARGGWRMRDYLDYNPSKQAVENDRKASAERQRRSREGRASRRDNAVTSTVTSPAPSRSRPGPKTADVVNRANGSNDSRASPELIDSIMNEIRDVTGRHITPEWAQRIAGDILANHSPANPAAYIRQVIRNEPDPRTRFLPLY